MSYHHYGHFESNVLVNVERYNFNPQIKIIPGVYMPITKHTYDQFIDAMESNPGPKELYAECNNPNEKIAFIAERIGLI